MKEAFRPKSTAFIVCLIILIIFTLGLFGLGVVGIIYTNWLFIIVGFLGFVIVLLEIINILSSKIVFYDNYLYFSSGVFARYLNQNKTLKVYYEAIKKFDFQNGVTQVIVLTCSNLSQPISIYVKQYSNEQIDKILNLLNAKSSNQP